MKKDTLKIRNGDYSKVVRVAVSNNFNCTQAEFKQVYDFQAQYPENFFFVNSNIKTRNLIKLNDHNFQAVITINPDLKVYKSYIDKLDKINKVAFVRVRYIPDNAQIDMLMDILCLKGYTVMVTIQRFNGKESLHKYSGEQYYTWSHNRYRLNNEYLIELKEKLSKYPNAYICDLKSLGCNGCGLCSKLTIGNNRPLYSLNLSSSGICKNDCPDCYAKTMQNFLGACGYNLINYDKVMMNSKQAGRTKHIQHNKEKTNA